MLRSFSNNDFKNFNKIVSQKSKGYSKVRKLNEINQKLKSTDNPILLRRYIELRNQHLPKLPDYVQIEPLPLERPNSLPKNELKSEVSPSKSNGDVIPASYQRNNTKNNIISNSADKNNTSNKNNLFITTFKSRNVFAQREKEKNYLIQQIINANKETLNYNDIVFFSLQHSADNKQKSLKDVLKECRKLRDYHKLIINEKFKILKEEKEKERKYRNKIISERRSVNEDEQNINQNSTDRLSENSNMISRYLSNNNKNKNSDCNNLKISPNNYEVITDGNIGELKTGVNSYKDVAKNNACLSGTVSTHFQRINPLQVGDINIMDA